MRFLLALFWIGFTASLPAQEYYLFVGTYTSGKSKGIYVYRLNEKTGELSTVSHTDTASNPSFLVPSPNGNYLYAVNENAGTRSGSVSAYAFDKSTGTLHLLNQVPTGGDDPCHVSITRNGKWLTVANYSGGSLAVFPIRPDGSLQPFVQLIRHQGKSVNPERQEKAHVHASFFSPDEKILLATDLGMDEVSVYPFRQDLGKPLQTKGAHVIKIHPGGGPRHLCFSPDNKFLYIMEEMGGSVDVYQYQHGNTVFLQRIASHPPDYPGQPGSADIHISPDGKFLYASNRGNENNIAIFAVLPDGRLKAAGYQSADGNGPRNFMIDPEGNFLLVANQQTNNIVVFRRNKEDGSLQPTLQQVNVPNPVCLKILYP
ncbi:MAG TPA: lactonase family protein [Sediminibacterium sp.]|nr:lactonase family protein [Sediminibacterium sp.]